MISTQISPSIDCSNTIKTDPTTLWASGFKAFMMKERCINRCVVACSGVFAVLSGLSFVSSGGLIISGVIVGSVDKRGAALIFGAYGAMIVGMCFFGVSASLYSFYRYRSQELFQINKYATIEGIVELRQNLLSDKVTFDYPNQIFELKILSPVINDKLQKLRQKSLKLDDEYRRNYFPECFARLDPELSAQLDRHKEKKAKWLRKWNEFRPILENALPNPQAELDINESREEV